MEVTVRTAAVWHELAAAALNALGANGAAFCGQAPEAAGTEEWAGDAIPCEEEGVKAYFPVDDLCGERLAALQARLAEAALDLPEFTYAISLRRVAAEDWAEAWKAYYRPIDIGVWRIVPSWLEEQPAPGRLSIRLDPGMAFGAGTHPTTQQSLSLLEQALRPGASVLDVGTGCGILAIAAALAGAASVLARDIDPVAVDTAAANAAANGVAARVRVERGDLLQKLTGRYDLILANLVAPLLLDMLPAAGPRLAPGGRLVMAGIISHREEEIKAAAAKSDLEICTALREGEWVAFLASRAGGA